jgi:hypothetical protein
LKKLILNSRKLVKFICNETSITIAFYILTKIK